MKKEILHINDNHRGGGLTNPDSTTTISRNVWLTGVQRDNILAEFSGKVVRP